MATNHWKTISPEKSQGVIRGVIPSKKRVQRTYDVLSEGWGDIKKSIARISSGYDNRIMGEVKSYLKSLNHAGYPMIADFGCGPGKQLAQCLVMMVAGHCVGIDISAAMLDRARNKLEYLARNKDVSLQLTCCDASCTPLPDMSVDLSYAKMLLHHVSKPIAVLREMARVTRTGGRVLVMVPGVNYQARTSVGNSEWFSHFPRSIDDPVCDPLGRFTVQYLQEIASHVGISTPRTIADQFEYQFETVRDYLKFMQLTGADSKMRGYGRSNWIDSYDNVISKAKGVVCLMCEFITLVGVMDR